MPCLFLRNVPDGMLWDAGSVDRLYDKLCQATGLPPEKIQIHLENTRY